MNNKVMHRAETYRKTRKKQKWLYRALSVAAAGVVFCTTYALILPAITMEGESAHIHGADCYAYSEVVDVFACPYGDHAHKEICYDSNGETLCGWDGCVLHVHDETCPDDCAEADFVYHVHDELCWQEDTLVCTLPEILPEEHRHTEECYAAGEPVCGLEEGGHTHDESCMGEISRELTCTTEEYEGHTHGDACYITEITSEPLCMLDHAHEDTCFIAGHILDCDIPESEGHSHGDECYTVEMGVVCEIPEEGHTHTEECYDRKQLCGMESEAEMHRHTEDCFAQITVTYSEPVLICEKEGFVRTAEECAQEFASLMYEIPANSDYDYDVWYLSAYDLYMKMCELYHKENPGMDEEQYLEWLDQIGVMDAYMAFVNISDVLVSEKVLSESVDLEETSIDVKVNGNLPQNGKLVISESTINTWVGQEDTSESMEGLQLFSSSETELHEDTYSPVWSFQYDMKILIGDYEWQPNEKVQVELTTDYPCDVDEIRVVHYLDTPEAIVSAQQQGTAQYYYAENITELFPRENAALMAVDATMTDAVCYTVLSSENGDVTCKGNVISFETDSFSIYSVNGYNDETGKTELVPNSTIEMKRGEVRYFKWVPTQGTTNTGRGTWTVEEGEEYVDFEVYNSNLSADGSTGNNTNFYQYYWLKLTAKEPSGTEKATIQFEYVKTVDKGTGDDTGTNGDFAIDGYVRVQECFYVQVMETDAELYIDDQVAENGCLIPTFTKVVNTDGYTYEWTRDDGETVNPVALEAPYAISKGAVNIAMDRGGIDAEDANTDKPMKTYTVTVKNGDVTVATAEYTVPYGNELLNGSFEYPKSVHVTHDYPNGAPGLYWKTTSESVRDNEVCQDIEILNKDKDFEQSNGTYALESTYGISKLAPGKTYTGSNLTYDDVEPDNVFPDGVQCAEINCDAPGALYQDILTYPGTSMYWQLSHRARNYSGSSAAHGGTWLPDGHSYTIANPKTNVTTTLTDQKDYMYVIAAPTDQVEHIKTQDQLNELISAAGFPVDDFTVQKPTTQYSFDANGKEVTYNGIRYRIWEVATDHTAWKNYASSAAYVVGDGEYLTRFFFAAGSTSHDRAHVAMGAAANYSGGNFIDNVSFSDEMPWAIEYYVDGKLQSTLTENGLVDLNRDTMRFPLNKAASYDSSNCDILHEKTLVKTEINGRPYRGTTLEEVYTNHNVLQLYYETYGVTVTKEVVIENIDSMTEIEKEELKEILDGYSVTFELTDNGSKVANAIVTIDPETRIGSATFVDLNGDKFKPDKDKTYILSEGELPEVNELTLTDKAADVPLSGAIVYASTLENKYEMILKVDVTLKKVSSDSKALSGAVFNLIDKDGKETEISVDQNGQYIMNALRIGQMYTLVEKKAPDGYMMLTNAVYFIPERNNIILYDKNGIPVNSIPNVETDSTLSIIITNHAGTELPQTGGPGITKLYMFSALLIAGAAGGLIYKTRRRQRG